MKKILGIDEKNRKLLDALNRSHRGPFSARDAAQLMGLSLENARNHLSYFARRGWLSRIKSGLYITVPLGTVNPQEYRGNPWIVANRIFAPCYIGGWSAAEHWHLTDQIFKSVFVFTYRPFRRKNVNVQGTEFVLKFIRNKKFSRTEGAWIENIKVQVSDPSQTIVDILNEPSSGGGIRHAAEIVSNYFNSEYRRDADLLRSIDQKKNRTIYKRLGYILETLGIKVSEISEVCKKNVSAGYSTLDPTVKSKGTFNRRWNLRINVVFNK